MTDIVKFGYDSLICDIPGFPGYQISTDGTVYKKDDGRELKNTLNKQGYFCVTFFNNNKKKIQKIHRLLAVIFINNPNGYDFVDHIDRNRSNNSLSNLRFVSRSQSQQNRNTPKNNSSGYKGIRVETDFRKNSKLIYWLAFITTNMKVSRKLFPYTDDGLKQAIEWRKQKEQELHTYD